MGLMGQVEARNRKRLPGGMAAVEMIFATDDTDFHRWILDSSVFSGVIDASGISGAQPAM
jgi:hypothetical protein